MDALMVAGAAASIGLVAGGLGDGAFAGGDAPWAPPLGAVALGGLGYAAATAVSGRRRDRVFCGRDSGALVVLC